MRTSIIFAALALAAVVIGAAASCAPGDPALEHIRETGVIRVGYAIEPPYAFIAPGGRVSGESAELARLVTERMGVRNIEWVLTSFDALIVELQEGRFDAIAAGMFVTPERAALVAFADPSLAVKAGLLVPKGNPMRLASYRDALIDPAARIAVLSGSVEELRLRARGMPDTRLLVVPDAITGRRAVESGAAHALALSLPSTRYMAKQFEGTLEAVAVPGRASSADAENAFHVAAAVSREHPHLLAAWNEAQARVLGSPEHLRAIAAFGFEPADLPSATTPARSSAR